MDFIPGQRWINDAELQMGLGMVINSDERTVTIKFQAVNESRTYAKHTAPLTRIIFKVGDMIKSQGGTSIKVTSVLESGGLLTYIGEDGDGTLFELPENDLDNSVSLNRPVERLFSGQIDQNKWFHLRYQTVSETHRLLNSSLYGLSGCRTSLIPHQLYIASEVSRRFAPRVLLADEVGLGKTIEAGLILHQQLLMERIQRVLIVVPENLLHQWLVEMLRRFNLKFSIFDNERCCSIMEHNPDDNPFHTEQLVLCSLQFLVDHPDFYGYSLGGDWDLLIVDEAHHLKWTESEASIEYTIIEQLARITRGVLLLTATPEQLGRASHFARLRLLDPDRFTDYESFIAEEKLYEPVADIVDKLFQFEKLNSKEIKFLSQLVKIENLEDELENFYRLKDSPAANINDNNSLVEQLLDRHGTGRVLFRNTRNLVKGFPRRVLHAYPLALDEKYRNYLVSSASYENKLTPEAILRSEVENWSQIDPRIDWLIRHANDLKPEKILVIAASTATVLEIAEILRVRAGIFAPVFHDQLSIIERDRAAAYFADPEEGSQMMICSEAGSEGRNFQFAHHLVLFDLPFNPDLLEQRIGRLDRIGQASTIHIHIPYMENTAQEIIYRWYHEGIDAIEHCSPSGNAVFNNVSEELIKAIDLNYTDIQELINKSRSLNKELNEMMEKGRDRLLELNSCRPATANELTMLGNENDRKSILPEYMDLMFDCFGVIHEEHSTGSYILSPGESMLTAFPYLPDDGMTITYSRDIALVNEDREYLTWEHPMVSAAMEIVQTSELGNTALTAIEYDQLTPGMLFTECIFILETASTTSLHTSRYLPAATIRVVIDETGDDYTEKLDYMTINNSGSVVDRETAIKIIKLKDSSIRQCLDRSEQLAQSKVPGIINSASDKLQQTLMAEIERLQALSLVNPNVRQEEISYVEDQLSVMNELINSASLRLDSVRIVISA